MARAGTLLPFMPRILRRADAALYVGLGPTTFDVEVAAGRAPRPVQMTNGVKGWDRYDLDAMIEERKAACGAGAPATADEWDDP